MNARGKKPSAFKHLKAAYRSGLEIAVAAALATAGVKAQYETVRIPFTEPAKSRTYRPDFVLPNGIIVETKGIWDVGDRQKHALVKAQHPDLDIRMVFTSPTAKIAKGSPTTYASICEKMGLQYARKEIPPAWLSEPSNERSLKALRTLGWMP